MSEPPAGVNQEAAGNPEGEHADGLTEHAPEGIRDPKKLRARVIMSCVAGAIIIGSIVAGDWGVTLALLCACFFASRELFGLFEDKGYNPARNLGMVSCLAIMVLTQLSEFLAIGLLAGLVAAAGAVALAMVLSERVLGVPYEFNWIVPAAGILAGSAGVAIAGLLGTRRAVDSPPLAAIRAVT